MMVALATAAIALESCVGVTSQVLREVVLEEFFDFVSGMQLFSLLFDGAGYNWQEFSVVWFGFHLHLRSQQSIHSVFLVSLPLR